jgi:hypothetical protein
MVDVGRDVVAALQRSRDLDRSLALDVRHGGGD